MRKAAGKIAVMMVCVVMIMGIVANGSDRASAQQMNTARAAFRARGVWHRPNSSGRETTLPGLCEVLDEFQAAGVNMVFLETFYHGMTVFKTNLIPYYTEFRNYSYGQYPDYLTAFACEAEKRGIEVHAWVQDFYVGIDETTPLVRFHPDWMLRDQNGQIRHKTEGQSVGGYLFLDPANLEVQDYLVAFYDELLTKVPQIKGLNLDYIRYPVSRFEDGTDTGYTPIAMETFSKQRGLTLSIENPRADLNAQIRDRGLLDAWTQYRADNITGFVGRVRAMVNSRHKGVLLSTAVFPEVEQTYILKKQDIRTWLGNGYIDIITPMVYFYDAERIASAVRDIREIAPHTYCYTGLYTTYHNQSVSELAAHIRASDGAGADGFVLFDSAKTFFDSAENYGSYLREQFGAADDTQTETQEPDDLTETEETEKPENGTEKGGFFNRMIRAICNFFGRLFHIGG